MICAFILGGRASLPSLGNHMDADTDLESRVKQAKRWPSSKWTDNQAHFIPYPSRDILNIVPPLEDLTTSFFINCYSSMGHQIQRRKQHRLNN